MRDYSLFTTGDDCRIAYRWDGEDGKPVLVLSNSIATTFAMWDQQIADLTGHFRVLRYDTRGHGASDAPEGAYSIDRLGRDVIELLDALRIERAHFCGLSLGGFIGQWLGVYAPDRIGRLILCNTSPYLGPAPQWDALIRKTRDAGDMSGFADMFIGNWFPAHMRHEGNTTIDTFRAMVLNTPPQGLAGCFAVVRDMDLRRVITLIPNPTLVIAGEYDTVTLPGHSEEIAASIPDARLLVLPAVHLSNVEYPVEFNRAVLEFLLEKTDKRGTLKAG